MKAILAIRLLFLLESAPQGCADERGVGALLLFHNGQTPFVGVVRHRRERRTEKLGFFGLYDAEMMGVGQVWQLADTS